MAYLTRSKVKEIIANAPDGVSPESIIDDLVAKGHTLEGYESPATAPNVAEQSVQQQEPKKSIFGKVNDFVQKGKENKLIDSMFGKHLDKASAVLGAGEDIVERSKWRAGEFANTTERLAEGQQTDGTATDAAKKAVTGIAYQKESQLRIAGDIIGGLSDVGASLLGAAIKSFVAETPIGSLPRETKDKLSQDIQSVLQTTLEKAGVPEKMEDYAAWKDENPNIAKDLEATLNIASIVPIGELLKPLQGPLKGLLVEGKAGLSGGGKAAGGAARALEESVESKAKKEVIDMISPNLTKKERTAALQSGGAEKGRFGTITATPNRRTLAIADDVIGVIDPKKSAPENIQLLKKDIGKTADEVIAHLKDNDAIFNDKQLLKKFTDAKENNRLLFAGDRTIENAYDSVVEEFMKQLKEQKNNLSGLLQARKNFDKSIERLGIDVFSKDPAQNVQKNAVRDIRRVANEFVAEKLPEGGAFENRMRRQTHQYEAIDLISAKNQADLNMTVFDKLSRSVGDNKLLTGLGVGGFTVSALTGVFSSPAILAALALGGTYKVGKMVFTSKTLRTILSKMLRSIENGVRTANTVEDIGILREALDALDNPKPIKEIVEPDLLPKANAVPEAATKTLEKEAAKYKTAEEFVKAQGETVYHHSVDNIEVFNDIAGGTWFTNNKFNYQRKPNAKFNNPTVVNIKNLKLANEKQVREIPIKLYEDQKRIDILKEKGFDGLIQKQDGETYYNIFDSTKIRTKQQLTDIWNKVHNGADIDKIKAKAGGKNFGPGAMSEEEKAFAETIRTVKGLSADDIMAKHPEIVLKRDIQVKDIHGNKAVIPAGEELLPYEMKGNKVILQDGETYVVSKNQYANIKNNSVVNEAKPFNPGLEGTEETIYGQKKRDIQSYDIDNAVDLWQEDNPGKKWGDLSESKQNKIIEDSIGDIEYDSKYTDYQLPDGKNYKEILIKAKDNIDISGKLPNGWIAENIPSTRNTSGGWVVKDGNGNLVPNKLSGKGKVQHAVSEEQAVGWSIGENLVVNSRFKSSHWDEPNVIAHLRLNERTYKGKKVTFMEELQSDWARELRSGKTDATNPLVQGNKWQEPSVKRALQEAVTNDSEYFAWINGKQTSARYNLATQVKEVYWYMAERGDWIGKKRIKIDPEGGGNMIILNIDDKGIISEGIAAWNGKRLDEVVGKGLADKIMADEAGKLSGEGLSFGGEWASNLYDKQVKNIVEKVTGGKVEKMDMGLPIKESRANPEFMIELDDLPGEVKLKTKHLKVGEEIVGEDTDYIITDVLGDGKFKAVDKEFYDKKSSFDSKWLEDHKKSFDISNPTSTQLGIKLTPEIKAKIRGEAPLGKKFTAKAKSKPKTSPKDKVADSEGKKILDLLNPDPKDPIEKKALEILDDWETSFKIRQEKLKELGYDGIKYAPNEKGGKPPIRLFEDLKNTAVDASGEIIYDIKGKPYKTNKSGKVTVYHETNIPTLSKNGFSGDGNDIYFTNNPKGVGGHGNRGKFQVLSFDIDPKKLEIADLTSLETSDNEMWFKVSSDRISGLRPNKKKK